MSNKLLLADDSITIQKVVGIIFANEDYQLSVVDNGNVVLEKARETQPDIILIDALMPGKTGYEVCAEVRRDPTLKNTPLLLLTGAFEPFDEDKAKSSGADDYISKPFESQHLIDKVKKLIELGKSRAKTAPTAALAPQKPAAAAVAEIHMEPLSSPAAPRPPVQPAVRPAVQPAIQPATQPAVKPAAQPAPPNPAAFGSELELEGNDIWGASTGAASAKIEEMAPEEDLWGAINTEQLGEAESIDFAVEPVGVSSKPVIREFEEIEPFIFDEGKDGIAKQPGVAQEPFQKGAAAADNHFAEESFVFGEEPAGKADQEFIRVGEAEPLSTREFIFSEDAFEVETTSPPAAPAPPAMKQQASFVVPNAEEEGRELLFAGEDEYVQLAEAPTPTPSTKIETQPAAAPGGLSFSDDQLAAVVARVSKELIEKIAWEVVPDLAEAIIKEEIRKLKEVKK